jgi:spermidine synthase
LLSILVISRFQKFLSQFYPVKVRSASGITAPILDLFLYRGRWQLGSSTALYSDGHHYRPLLAAFKYLRKDLLVVENMLVLGAGLGSAAYILDRMKLNINTTFVDIDPTIINWAKELLPERLSKNNHWVCADAAEYIKIQQCQFEIIVIDIFIDRIVPQFVCSTSFLEHCKQLLKDDQSKIILNYIVNNKENWEEARENLNEIFRIQHVIDLGLNQIVIAKVIS